MRRFRIDLNSMSRVKYLAGAALVAGLVAANSGASVGTQKKSGSETGLIGVTLYDPGVKLIRLFGSPDEIEAVTTGATSVGGPAGGLGKGGGGGPAGAPGGGMRRGPAPGGPSGPTGGGPGASGADFEGPVDPAFDFANGFLGQGPAGAPPLSKGGGAPAGVPGGPSGPGGFGPGGPGGFGPGRGGPGGGATGSSTNTVFTRWIYKRDNSKYGFVMDKYNRVVQIEAIGLANGKVHTKRGIAFGSSFGTILTRYAKNPDGASNQPDGYEISGNTVVVRYLVKNKVAFKLSRLGKDKPYVVTGIVIAAGSK